MISRIINKFLNQDGITPYRRCKNQILVSSLSGKSEVNCSSKLSKEEIDTLHKEGFEVFPIYLPWMVDDPFDGVKMANLVRWPK